MTKTTSHAIFPLCPSVSQLRRSKTPEPTPKNTQPKTSISRTKKMVVGGSSSSPELESSPFRTKPPRSCRSRTWKEKMVDGVVAAAEQIHFHFFCPPRAQGFPGRARAENSKQNPFPPVNPSSSPGSNPLPDGVGVGRTLTELFFSSFLLILDHFFFW